MFGFNLDLCPVLDLSYDDEADNSLKGRCYGTTPKEVIDNASVFNHALRKEGVLSCGKHFPATPPPSAIHTTNCPSSTRPSPRWRPPSWCPSAPCCPISTA
jgi:beta-glucosidase-like glycosyl hydrolase